jgi:Ca-activated chloride channel family protein
MTLKFNYYFLAAVLAFALPAMAQDEPTQPPRSSQVPRPPAATVPAPNSVPKPPRSAPDQRAPADTSGQSGDQSEPSNDAGVFVFRKQVQEVILHATVVDTERRLVTSLQKNNFSVFEDGRAQVITAFRREDVPVALGIVVDNSGSMQEKRGKVNQAVLNLVHDSNPDDEVFVVNFGEDYYLDQDFTSDVNLVRAALQQNPMKGKTALYDAIVASAAHLKGSARLEKKVLLVITDGQDNASQETLREAAYRLQQQNGPILYAIGILGADDHHPGHDPLATLAESTGGVAFFPQTLDDVGGISRTIARDIRSQFILGYKSDNPQPDGGYRNIRVDAASQGLGQLTVRTRSGYIPGQPLQ